MSTGLRAALERALAELPAYQAAARQPTTATLTADALAALTTAAKAHLDTLPPTRTAWRVISGSTPFAHWFDTVEDAMAMVRADVEAGHPVTIERHEREELEP